MFRFLIAFIAVAITSCGKKEANVTTPPKEEEQYAGYLHRHIGFENTVNNPRILQVAMAEFFEDEKADKRLEVEKVWVNNTELNKDIDERYLTSSDHDSELDMNNGVKWKVIGKGEIPSFEYYDNRPFPEIANIVSDTVSLSEGVVFRLQFKHADSVEIILRGGGVTKSKRFSASDEAYTFFPQEIASEIFHEGELIWLEMFIAEAEEKWIDGKKFLFYSVNRPREMMFYVAK